MELRLFFRAAGQGVIKKDPTVWLDGTRSPENAFASIIKLANWSSDYFSGQLARGFLIRILLFGYMELDNKKYICKYYKIS